MTQQKQNHAAPAGPAGPAGPSGLDRPDGALPPPLPSDPALPAAPVLPHPSRVPLPARGEPFGQRAIRLGFIGAEDLALALAEQRRRDSIGREHELIGMILVEMGFLTTTQLLAILKVYEEERGSPP